MRSLCILPMLFCLAVALPARGQSVSKAKSERSRKFVALGNFVSAQSDDAGINLLIDYEISLENAGEQDLADWITVDDQLRPKYARRIFDTLLRSKNSRIVCQCLEWLGYDYAYICKDEEISLVKSLLRRKDHRITLRASRVLDAVGHDKKIDRDFFLPDQHRQTSAPLE